MKIAIISDTHNLHIPRVVLPPADAIVHCGDSTGMGTIDEVLPFMHWFETLPYQHKIFIAGNHDFLYEKDPTFIGAEIANRDFIYLQDSGVTIEGVKFYGSPWQPWFHNWAFNLPRGPDIAAKWARIPEDTDFLITHGPPAHILDKTLEGDYTGCKDLLDRIEVVKPKIHAFGHIHEGYGKKRVGDTLFVNASTCTRACEPTNRPIVVEI